MAVASKRGAALMRSRAIGVVVLALFALMLWVALTATNGLPGSQKQHYRLGFDNVGGLRAGDDVRVADIRVGHVEDIKLVDGHPVVKIAIEGDRKMYRDGSARIAQRSALGQNYVAIEPGTPKSGELAESTVLAAPPSGAAQDLSNVLDVLDAKTRKALGSTLREVGGGAVGHAKDLNAAAAALPSALTDLSKVSDALAVDNGADLTQLLEQANGLAQAFSGQQEHLTALEKQLASTIDALNVDKGAALSSALNSAPQALENVRGGLAALQQPLVLTRRAVENLRPGAKALGEATPNLRGLLREAVPALDRVPGVAKQAVGPVGNLTTLIDDARPLAPHLTKTVQRVATPLAVLSPYSPEVAEFFTNFRSALNYGNPNKHYLRVFLIASTQTVDGILPIDDPLTARNAYPAPGQAHKTMQTALIGERRDW